LLLALVLALGFLAPAGAVQAAPMLQDGGVKATVKGDLVNLRSGPGTAYKVVARAKAGEALTATGKNADGVGCSYWRRQGGWVSTRQRCWPSCELPVVGGRPAESGGSPKAAAPARLR
jgi:N-acetylmuramoyl-L-alanine amidase